MNKQGGKSKQVIGGLYKVRPWGGNKKKKPLQIKDPLEKSILYLPPDQTICTNHSRFMWKAVELAFIKPAIEEVIIHNRVEEPETGERL